MKYGKILPQCEIQGFVFDRKISTYFGRKNRRHIINTDITRVKMYTCVHDYCLKLNWG